MFNKLFQLLINNKKPLSYIAGGSLCAYVLVNFIVGMIESANQALYFIVYAAVDVLLILGLYFGYKRENRPVLYTSFLLLIGFHLIPNAISGMVLYDANDARYGLFEAFRFVLAVITIFYLVIYVLNHLFNKNLKTLEQVGFFATLCALVLYYIFAIVYATMNPEILYEHFFMPLFAIGVSFIMPLFAIYLDGDDALLGSAPRVVDAHVEDPEDIPEEAEEEVEIESDEQ